MEGLLYIGIVVALFLVGRAVTLWYFRVDDIIKNQQRTNDLLEQIVANQEDIFNASQVNQSRSQLPTP